MTSSWFFLSTLKLVVVHRLVGKFPEFYGARRFITVFPRARPLSPDESYVSPVHVLAINFLDIFFNIILPPNPYMHLIYPYMCLMPRLSYSSSFNHPDNIWQRKLIIKLLGYGFIHYTLTCSILGPNISFNILVTNPFILCSSHNVRDQASHPYKTTGKIVVLCIFMFFESERED